jgi:translation initiation factor 1
VIEPAGLRPDTVYVERSRKGRGGKTVTLILNLPLDDGSKRSLLKQLKATCGAGGTMRDGSLEIQGDHRDRLRDVLVAAGYRVKLRGG